MDLALISGWNAELVAFLSDIKKGTDKADARLLAGIEDYLVTFLERTVLGNLEIFFPGVLPTATVGVMLQKNRSFELRALGRAQREPNSLQITVLEQGVAVQRLARPIKIVGLPALSGLNDCRVDLPEGLEVNSDLLKELVSQTFHVGYDWAITTFRDLVSRHFDLLGSPFYRAFDPHLATIQPRAANRFLLTFYHDHTEYPLVTADTVNRFVKSVDNRVGELPRQSVLEFARFQLAAINDEDSPFRELIRTKSMVVCPLVGDEGQFYVAESGVKRFMRAIYRDAVALYPLVAKDQLILAANFHPADVGHLAPAIDRVRPTAELILERNQRAILKNIHSLKAIKDILERDHSRVWLQATLPILRALPDLIEVGAAAVDAGGRIFGQMK